MNKEQLKNEVNRRVETLKSYLDQVQKIENYRYDIECQSFFPTVNGIIRKMNRSLQNLLSLSDADFNSYNIAGFINDLDNMMIEPRMTWEHIKSKGPLPRRPYGEARKTAKHVKLPKSCQKLLIEDEPSEPGLV